MHESGLSSYRTTLARRDAAERREHVRRKAQAREVARRVASWLKQTYDVTRVVLFGSMASEAPLGPRSDIDLAVWGLDARYYEAVAQAQDEAAPFAVDLVRIEQCPDSLRAVIEKEGHVL